MRAKLSEDQRLTYYAVRIVNGLASSLNYIGLYEYDDRIPKLRKIVNKLVACAIRQSFT